MTCVRSAVPCWPAGERARRPRSSGGRATIVIALVLTGTAAGAVHGTVLVKLIERTSGTQ